MTTAVGRCQQSWFAALDSSHDILQYNNRIIDNQADCQDKSEQGERVYREIEGGHDDEGRYNRNRNGQGRDNRGTNSAEKCVDYDQHEQHRETERLGDLHE